MNIAVFYHIYQSNDWQKIVDEQYSLLKQSRLLDYSNKFLVGINGDLPVNIPEANIFRNNGKDEDGTLQLLLKHALSASSPVLYIHTKGAYHSGETSDDWRKMMNYFCVEKWENALIALNENSAVGCNLQKEPYPHFSGNFWWAKPQYISTCDSFLLYTDDRMDRERFIGSGIGNLKSLFDSKTDHYLNRFPQENYIMR